MIRPLNLAKLGIGTKVWMPLSRPQTSNSSYYSTDLDRFLGQELTIAAENNEICNFSEDAKRCTIKKEYLLFSPHSAEDIEAVRIRNLAELEEAQKRDKERGLTVNAEEIYKYAVETFGEERVDLTIRSRGSYAITIYYPELEITNSNRNKHLMTDLYAKFEISIDNQGKPLIDFQGKRASFNIREYSSNYTHSHLSSSLGGWQQFCLGSSNFKILLEDIRRNPEPEKWQLMFMSVTNFLNWESLEGGPYRRIADISHQGGSQGSGVSNSQIEAEVRRLLPQMPLTIFALGENLDILDSHDDYFEFFDKNSRIRELQTTGSVTQIRDAQANLNNRHFMFKDRKITPQITDKVKETSATIEKDVIDKFTEQLKKETKKFINNKVYNDAKRNSNTITQIRAF